MIENLLITGPQIINPCEPIMKITDDIERQNIVNNCKNNDEKWGFDLGKKYHFLNNYENDDYLFVADLLEDVRNIHKNIYYDATNDIWIRGNSEIPYIHLEFCEEDVFLKDENQKPILDENGMFIPDDKNLNMGVEKPLANGTHVLKFNYYWLKQYLKFLQIVFDSNEEFLVYLPPERSVPEERYGTKQQLLKMAKEVENCGLKKQADILRIYVKNSHHNDKIKIPEMIFMNENEHIEWGFVDKERNVISIPMKKSIYNTSGFASLFQSRVFLVTDIFISSLEMILAHETAHIARGHWNLRVNEVEYSQQRNVMMNCEIQADHTAMRWLLNELLYDTITGEPQYPILAYTKEHLIYLWSVRIFSAYLSLSWGYREDERVWCLRTINEFCEDRNKTHPPYQFRVFSILNHAKEHLDHMEKQNSKEGYIIRTADNKPLDKDLFEQVWSKTMDMVYSFEVGLKSSWGNDERSVLQKLEDGLNIEKRSIPNHMEEIPFMMAFMEQSQKELAEYEKQWPEILEKLKQYGMYFVM